jgi:hypothetical protein
MSTGHALLRQLQSRQACKTVASTESDTSKACPWTDATTADEAVHGCRITVCTGLHCGAGRLAVNPNAAIGCGGLGAGTSATLIEIEELVQEHAEEAIGSCSKASARRIDVQSGGCTDHCSVGPNVFVRIHHGVVVHTATTKHWTKVASADSCRRTVAQAMGVVASDPDDSSLLRRAHGLRWKALKELARAETSQAHGTRSLQKDYSRKTVALLLEEAFQAELGAVKSNKKQVARAKRRRDRLLERLRQTCQGTSLAWHPSLSVRKDADTKPEECRTCNILGHE